MINAIKRALKYFNDGSIELGSINWSLDPEYTSIFAIYLLTIIIDKCRSLFSIAILKYPTHFKIELGILFFNFAIKRDRKNA